MEIHKFVCISVISFFVLSSVMHSTTYAVTTGGPSTPPDSADIEALAQKAAQMADTFMQESIEARLAYECSGRFLSRDQQNKLHLLAKTSSEQLEIIIDSQRLLKKQMGDCEVDDWDERYGESGLWRRLEADLERSILTKCEVDYFQALSATENEKRLLLYNILNRLALVSEGCRNTNCMLLKTKVFIALSLDSNDYRRLARNLLNLLLTEPDIDEKIYLKAAVVKIKLTGQSKSDQLEELAVKLANECCRDDFELNLSVAFLQRRFGSIKGLERVSQKWPEARAFMGKIILQDLQSRHFEQLSVVEAELAAEAAWHSNPVQYAAILNAMTARQKLQTPLVLYVAAAAQAESSPAEAIEMLMKASRLRQLKEGDGFPAPAEKIAGEAAELAYQLFTREPSYCELTRRAIASYMTLTKSEPEQRIEYFYGVVLNSCGRTGEGKELLSRIAEGKGKYRHKARYELIALAAQEQSYNEPERRADLIRQLNDLIAAVSETDEFDREVLSNAKLLYCQLLVAQADESSAKQALSILAELEKPAGKKLSRLNSRALQQAGRLKEALQVLVRAVDVNDCADALQGLELLLKITERIDEYELQAHQGQADDFDSLVRTCRGLAEYCFRCVPDPARPKAAVVLAELSIFAADEQNERLLQVDRMLADLTETIDEQDVDLLRCRARLLRAIGRYDEAAVIWSRICQMRKADRHWETSLNRLWWRAKFYQFDCQSRIPDSSRQEILHGLDILESGFGEIPEPWAEKLNKLKKALKQTDAADVDGNSLAQQM